MATDDGQWTKREGIELGTRRAAYGPLLLIAISAASGLMACSRSEIDSPAGKETRSNGQAVVNADPHLHKEAKAESTDVPVSSCLGAVSNRRMRPLRPEVVLRQEPNMKAEKVVNERATRAFGETHFATMDPSDLLEEDCKSGEWSHVRIIEPDHRTEFSGWIKTSQARILKTNSNGGEEYTPESFIWNNKTRAHAELITKAVNEIKRQNPRCQEPDLGSIDISSGKGSSTDPVFYVTCRNGDRPFNVFFSKSEIEKSADLSGKNIDHSIATRICEEAAMAAAANPETVKFSEAYSLRIIDFPNGRTKVESKFRAKNKLGIEQQYKIDCMFGSTELIEARVFQ